MKTTIRTNLAALIAFAGMEALEANAVAIRQTDSIPTGEHFKPAVAEYDSGSIASAGMNHPIVVKFENESDKMVELFWEESAGNHVSYGQIGAGKTKAMYTFGTQPWTVTGLDNSLFTVGGDDVYVPVTEDGGRTITIAQAWTELEGMCKDSNDNQYDDFRQGREATYDSRAQCQADCSATPGCMAINLSPTWGEDGQCILRMTEGAQVDLPGYIQFWDYTGVGPVDHANRHGDFKCYINPAPKWIQLEGMCNDSSGNQYDDFRKPDAAYESLEQCQMDCAASSGCVGINISENAEECILRMTEGAQVTLPEYFQFGDYTGVGAVGQAQRHGDYKCYINPAYV